MESNQDKKRVASSPAQSNLGKRMDEKESPTSPSSGLFSYLFSGGAQKNAADRSERSPISKFAEEEGDHININSEGFERAYEEESRANMNRWSPSKTANLIEAEREKQKKGQEVTLGYAEPIFKVNNDGAMREELEVEIETLNGKPFKGSITVLKAKYKIYRDSLGYENFSNFDGVRLGYRGGPVATFKFKEAINVDELLCIQYFEYKRTYTRQGNTCEDIIGCKIRGLRPKPVSTQTLADSSRDDGSRIVNVEGCEYRVPKEEIIAWLELYGCVKSELVEDCFKDEQDTEGTNRTGSYSIKMKLDQDIPQMLPMSGRKIKIYYRGIQKLCTNCFGKHQKRNCQSKKVPWIDYVCNFIADNPDIPEEYYGKWSEIVRKVGLEKVKRPILPENERERSTPLSSLDSDPERQADPPSEHLQERRKEIVKERDIPTTASQVKPKEKNPHPQASNTAEETKANNIIHPPRAKDFNIPENEDEYNQMIEGMIKCGMRSSEAEANLKTRKTAFNKAIREYERDNKPPATRKAAGKGRKSSF